MSKVTVTLSEDWRRWPEPLRRQAREAFAVGLSDDTIRLCAEHAFRALSDLGRRGIEINLAFASADSMAVHVEREIGLSPTEIAEAAAQYWPSQTVIRLIADLAAWQANYHYGGPVTLILALIDAAIGRDWRDWEIDEGLLGALQESTGALELKNLSSWLNILASLRTHELEFIAACFDI